MASTAELTAQVVALTDQVQTLTARVTVAEQNVTLSVMRTCGWNDSGVFDKNEALSQRAQGEHVVSLMVRAVHRLGGDGQ